MKFDIKHILIFGLALGMTSCVETMKDGDMSTGFLGVPVLDADIQVEEFGATKAAPAPTLPTLSVPESSALHFKVTDSKSNPVWDKDGLWSDPLQMPVGPYTIEVTYGSNTYGNPWYTGTYKGTISAVTEAAPAISLSLCNSLLAVVLADDLTQHFTPSEGECVTIRSTSENSENSKSITTTLGNYVFVPAEEPLTIEVRGKSSAGVDKTLSWTLNPLSAATATYVTCSLTTNTDDIPTITMSEIPAADAWGNTAYVPLATTANISDLNVAQMQYFASSNNWTESVKGTIVDVDREKLVKFTGLTPGATYMVRAQLGALKSNEVSMTMSTSALSIKTAAANTYNTNNELDGTDFTASFSVAEKFGVTASSLQLCKTDGTPLRTVDHLTGTSADWTSDGSTLEGDDTWPFLPAGDYILTGTATQNGSTVTLKECQVNVSATPDFEVSVSGKTTYDYSKTDIDKANSLVAETIYEVGYSVSGISAALLKNSNYGLSCQYAININGNSKNVTPTDGTITGCSWGVNNLTATVTFAGTQKISSKLCDVTGLPYRASTKNDFSLWTLDRFSAWDGSYLKIKESAKLTFPDIPTNISVRIESKFGAGYASIATDFTLNISGAKGNSSSNPNLFPFEGKGGWANTKGNEIEVKDILGTLTNTNPTIECTSSYSAGNTHSRLWYINVFYN